MSRTMERHERRLVIRSLIVGGVALIGAVIIIIVGKRAIDALRVRDVSCTYASLVCPSALREYVTPLSGAILLRLPRLATARHYTIQRTFPDRVDVTFTQAPVLLSFHTSEATASAYSLSTDGHVDRFEINRDQTIIAIDDELRRYADWASVHPDVLSLYEAIMTFALQADHSALAKVYRTSETETILVFANEMVAIIRDEGAQKMLNTLQAVLTSPTMELSKKTIDLRFDNPVIR